MMERRLKLAKTLLNPDNSVLIVTIDEKEYLRLGMLLQQIFPEARQQMVSSVISPGGVPREREFTRVNEFLFFVMVGGSGPAKAQSDLLFTAWKTDDENRSPIWRGLLRGGSGPLRSDSPLKFYPIFVNPEEGRIVGCGDPLPREMDRPALVAPPGIEVVWPLKTGGVEGRWELNRETFEARRLLGYVKLGRRNRTTGQWGVSYLREAEIARLANGELLSAGMTKSGHLEIDYAPGRSRQLYAKSVWNEPSHDAGTHGAGAVKALVPGRKFDFPKSLYAVEDTLRLFVADKPDAVILDFFAGSGTTAHAVMRLNKQDGGRRQCISVTNNEVSAEEQKALRTKGLRPGDPEWKAQGICDYITKPRIEAAITGRTPDGEPIKGDYKFTDEFPMADGFEANAEFFTLTYEAPLSVQHNRAFAQIAPLLWLRAGATGRRIEEVTEDFAIADTYAVLFDLDCARQFVEAVGARIKVAYVVTDDERGYQSVCAQLPEGVEPVRLYSSYLTNFSFGGED